MTDRDNQDCQGFYEVSGYTTDDGKKVESYTRRCWKHGNGVSNTFIGQMPLGQINNTNSTVNKTENKVNEFTKFVENILKQKEVSNENIDSIKDNFIDIINNLCNSIENLSVKKSKLPENPTLESVEELKNIDKERKQVYETTHKAIVTTNLAKSALEKNFKSVDTEDKDYHKKLYEHIHNKEKLKKISDSLMELFNISSSINKNSISKVNKIKEDLGINNITYNGLTGSAANINNLLSFETVQIPYTNEEEQQPDLLHGHVEKPDDNIIEVNYEVEKLENQNNIEEEDVEEILEEEKEIINTICENCEQLQNTETDSEKEKALQNKIENDVKEVTKINNKLEKITIENDTISYKLRAKIRQLSVGLYNLYVSIKNKQKEKIIYEIFKIKDMLETKQENQKSEKTNSKISENESQKWIWPCKGKIVGEYDEVRSDHIHKGIDIAVPENTPVKAIADGKVVEARPATGYGKFVVIEHSLNGQIITSEYGHINKWIVSQGQYVKQGQIIAYSGNTGHSYGPHVHLTIRIGKYKGRAVNPWNYVIH